MKLLLPFLMLLFSFSLCATNGITYAQKIKNASTLKEKEDIFLEWVMRLSQEDNFHCDSIIENKNEYISKFSDDGKIALLVIQFNNSRLRGSASIPDINTYDLNQNDQLLMEGLVKCFKKEPIYQAQYNEIKRISKYFENATRKSIFYSISTCLSGIDSQSKIKFFEAAIQHAKASPVETLTSSVYDLMYLYYTDLEDFETAILNQQKGLLLAKKHKLTANTLNHLTNIGHIHFKLGNISKAEEAFFEAKQLGMNKSLDFIYGKLYNGLGELYNSLNRLNESIKFYKESLIMFYSIKNSNGLAIVHKNIGKTYFKSGDIGLAESNYKMSLTFEKELKNPGERGELFYLFAQLYLQKNQLKYAEDYIIQSINYWKERNYLIPVNKAYLLYSKIKKEQGDLTQANEFLEKYINFSDSFHKLETERKVAEISELFKSEQKERKIIAQEKKLDEGKSERILVQNKLEYTKQVNNLIMVILIISLVLFVALFILISTRNKQEQLKKKQKEIELQQTLLRTQMNPHFIFNAMSVIQSYIYDEDIPNSSKFLIHFSKLMRLILENNAKEFIPMDKEIEIINRYLVIQKMRFEDRFNFTLEHGSIKDHSRILIPPMLVQPFIENSIEHGDLDKVENGHIRIHCEIVRDLFIFTIEDNGIGRKFALEKKKSGASENHRSMAIQLTKDRITLLNEKYKGKGYLRIEDLDKDNQTGTIVTIATPYNKNY